MNEPWAAEAENPAFAASMLQKCLPTYLLVDVSSSMSPHEQTLNDLLDFLHGELVSSPRVSEFAYISIVVFSSEPTLVLEMTDLQYVPSMPRVQCSGSTQFGKAFDLVRQRIEMDVPLLRDQGKAVLRPAVFFLTDGAPMDPDWESAFRRLVDPQSKRRPHVIAFGFGKAREAVLSRVATKAAFLAEGVGNQREALTEAINSLLNSLVASARAEEMRIPAEAEGFRSIPIEYVE
ncbi:vWA domain-containing protein [Streptomyces aidingensis]|uniref:Uncharacterized conserved protein YegL, contains vWA domain of TerY type n=1 Tax=Streptomyces aidingensis TaxID=910347 RepID=A0A1I1EDK8_9ACTN|nr:VWA domain-containing protein [Streptomyces aidingensis]SFB84672.1 Uncharacterized conserved protein YegL, contains vWA domain of TerY type [Streptomyces aidingensis]